MGGSNLIWLWTVFLFVCTAHVAYIDIRTRCIPNRVLGGYASGMLVLFGCSPGLFGHGWCTALATLLVMGCLFIVYTIGSSYIGGGDIKYTMLLSLALGWSGTLYMLAVASWLAILVAFVRRIVARVGVGEPMPFAPFLGCSTMVIWLWQHYS